MLAKLVPGSLELRNGQVVDRVDVVLHILIVLCIQENHDAWEDNADENQRDLDGVQDRVSLVLVDARDDSLPCQVCQHRVVEVSDVAASASNGTKLIRC